jgi:glycosyltransferase involved in cell wall biosynthesis
MIVAPSIAILLCTYNGARFLPAQLASFAQQTFTNWRLYASDDGSIDETVAILVRNRHKALTNPLGPNPKAGTEKQAPH